MKTAKIILIAFILISKGLYSQTVDTNFVDGWIYVKVFDTSVIELSPYNFSDPDLNNLYSVYNIDSITKPFPGLNVSLDKTYRVVFSDINEIENLITDFQTLPYIEYAEKAPLYRTSNSPNDLQASQWALAKINSIQAWDITTGSAAVSIALVDNAVSTTHEDLNSNIWINPGEIDANNIDDDLNGFTDDVNGWDVADNNNNPNPPTSATSSSAFVHGTHCAGIASSATNNAIGIASLGYNTKIIAVKCSNDNSSDEGNSLPYAYDGVYYAIQAKADIISMSWGGSSGFFLTGESIINAANAMGITLIAAAGNNNSSTPFYPAAYNNVISVGATDQLDQKASFSNFGSTIDVMAPGVSIFSTLSSSTNNSYGSLSGTSMACPLVAGLAGLILSVDPDLSPSEVKTFLKNGCENIDSQNLSYTGQIGAGRINAYNTLQALSIEKFDNKKDFNIYPNPSSGFFTIEVDNFMDYTKIEVFNLIGKSVYSSQMEFKGKHNIDLKNVDSGIYLVKLESPSKVIVRKVFVEN
ncbi:MAG: S8 family peptidase [Bacteroidota bacterium]|nr:S8 family peptidase [Bacteroidota bacterium]